MQNVGPFGRMYNDTSTNKSETCVRLSKQTTWKPSSTTYYACRTSSRNTNDVLRRFPTQLNKKCTANKAAASRNYHAQSY